MLLNLKCVKVLGRLVKYTAKSVRSVSLEYFLRTEFSLDITFYYPIGHQINQSDSL